MAWLPGQNAFQGMARNTGISGNIKSLEFVENVGPRRLKHGGMRFEMYFGQTFLSASKEIENYLETKGLTRGQDYHIPGWNKANPNSYNGELDYKLGGFYITFNSDEDFVMNKMAWDLATDDDDGDTQAP